MFRKIRFIQKNHDASMEVEQPICCRNVFEKDLRWWKKDNVRDLAWKWNESTNNVSGKSEESTFRGREWDWSLALP
jgi:hypothetical protein